MLDMEIKLKFNDHKEIYTSDLIITNITHNISGVYRCQVMNNNTQFSFFSSASISISVQSNSTNYCYSDNVITILFF